MPGYVKVWTTLTNKREFLTLSALNRGLYLQVLLWCKARGDSGSLVVQSWAALGSLWGCDGKTARKSLGKLQENSLLTYINNEDGSIEICVPKYRLWQDIDVKTVVANARKKPRKIPPLRPDQTRPDQTNLPAVEKPPKKTNPDHKLVVEYFCSAYEQKIGAAYAFHGKEDGGKIKTLLSRWSLAQIKYLIDTMFASKNEFYRTKGGYTIGTLLATDNTLVQELRRKVDGTNDMSPLEAKNAATIAKVLQEMECQATPKLSQK